MHRHNAPSHSRLSLRPHPIIFTRRNRYNFTQNATSGRTVRARSENFENMWVAARDLRLPMVALMRDSPRRLDGGGRSEAWGLLERLTAGRLERPRATVVASGPDAAALVVRR